MWACVVAAVLPAASLCLCYKKIHASPEGDLSLIHISEPTRLGMTSYAVFCLKKKTPKVVALLAHRTAVILVLQPFWFCPLPGTRGFFCNTGRGLQRAAQQQLRRPTRCTTPFAPAGVGTIHERDPEM